MATKAQERKLMSSIQFAQWQRLGLAKMGKDQGEIYWTWTELARETYKTATLATVANFVMGLPIYPIEADRAAIEPLIREDWTKDGFDKNGFVAIDEI